MKGNTPPGRGGAAREGAPGAPPPGSPAVGSRESAFWRELYAFIAISLAGVAIGLAVVPPKARRYWSLVQLEADLVSRNLELEREIERLRAAAYSLETDPVYREAAMREVLGVKKKTEEYLEPAPSAGR